MDADSRSVEVRSWNSDGRSDINWCWCDRIEVDRDERSNNMLFYLLGAGLNNLNRNLSIITSSSLCFSFPRDGV
jgi:hypothetical protein